MVQFKRGRKSPWQVQVRDSSGQIHTHSFTRKSDAEDFAQAERRKRQLMKAGLEAPREAILFIDYSKDFIRRRYKELTRGTVDQDASRLKNYWLKQFGLRPLSTISSAEIKEQLDHIQFELNHSPADRNRHRALLHTLFQYALMDDKVVFNPVAKIPLVQEKPRRKSGTLEPRDQDAFVSGMYQKGVQYGVLSDIMLWTGARIMAAAALRWQDVDFDAGVVRFRSIIERASGTLQERTKGSGEGGEDAIPLLPRLRDALLAHRRDSEYIRPSDFVAAQPGGSYVAYESYRDVREDVLKDLKIPRFTPHAIRKAFATNAKRAGLTRAEIRELLGHSSEAVVSRYDLKDIGHLVDKTLRVGFGESVSRVSAKRIGSHRISRKGKR